MYPKRATVPSYRYAPRDVETHVYPAKMAKLHIDVPMKYEHDSQFMSRLSLHLCGHGYAKTFSVKVSSNISFIVPMIKPNSKKRG